MDDAEPVVQRRTAASASPREHLRRRDVVALLGAAGVLLAIGCASQVHHETAPGADLGAAKTYAWVTDEPGLISMGESQPNVRTPENEQRIRAAIDRALAQRGLEKVARDAADVHVSFSVGTRVRYRLEGGPDSWIASLTPGEKQTKGTLHIYVLHPGDEREVWHGWTSKWLDKSDDPDRVIGEAVARIMAKYPG